jgi:5-methylcytosine-specific restriction endonuclease McrA
MAESTQLSGNPCRDCGGPRQKWCTYCESCKARRVAAHLVEVKARSKEVRRAVRRSGHRNQDKHRKRARKFGVAYDPAITRLGVLERDGWVCWICSDPIPNILWMTAASAQHLYGTIDHVQEMCLGGSHTWDNVRAAHHRCNWERSTGIRAA